MKNSGFYAEKKKAEKDLKCLLCHTLPSNNSSLAEEKNYGKKVNDSSTVNSLANSPHNVGNKERFYSPTELKMKNPAQKFEVVDSSDDELVQDTNEQVILSGRMLEAIPSSIATRAQGVKILNLTDNQMKRWTLLSRFTSLVTLVLDKNNLKNLEGLPSLKTLKTLWLNNNRIDDFEQVLQKINSLFPNLEYLSMLRNPINPAIYFGGENEKPYDRYRRKILQEMPNLKVIDTLDVTAKEREDAKSHPKFLIARPQEYDGETTEDEYSRKQSLSYYDEKEAPAAFIGMGRIEYACKESEGNRFITNLDL